MNEVQHSALDVRNRAAQRVNAARVELTTAKVMFVNAELALQHTIDADQGSWSGTPGLNVDPCYDCNRIHVHQWHVDDCQHCEQTCVRTLP